MRYYSKTTGCSYLSGIHAGRMPEDAVKITDALYQKVIANPKPGKVRSHDAAGMPILIDPPTSTAPAAPSSVTMRQARLALHAAGLLQAVEDAISGLPGSEQAAARIEWDYASRVERSSQFVAMLGAAIGLDDAHLDALFMSASTL